MYLKEKTKKIGLITFIAMGIAVSLSSCLLTRGSSLNIKGKVIDDTTGEPIPNTQIVLETVELSLGKVPCDQLGRFDTYLFENQNPHRVKENLVTRSDENGRFQIRTQKVLGVSMALRDEGYHSSYHRLVFKIVGYKRLIVPFREECESLIDKFAAVILNTS